MSDPFAFLPQSWSDTESGIWQNSFGEFDAFYDPIAQTLYNEAFFNFDAREGEVSAIRTALNEYLEREYGIDFDAEFDWDAWRDAYGE